MRISDAIFQTNTKLFLVVIPKNAYKLKFDDNLWLPFLDQPQSDIVVFEIINLRIYTSRNKMETCHRY